MFSMMSRQDTNCISCPSCDMTIAVEGKICPIMCPYCQELIPDGFVLADYVHKRIQYYFDKDLFV